MAKPTIAKTSFATGVNEKLAAVDVYGDVKPNVPVNNVKTDTTIDAKVSDAIKPADSLNKLLSDKLEELRNIVERNKVLQIPNTKVNSHQMLSFNRTRSNDFYNKYIDKDSGRFIEQFDWLRFYQDLKKFRVKEAKYSTIVDYVSTKEADKVKSKALFESDYVTGGELTFIELRNSLKDIRNNLETQKDKDILDRMRISSKGSLDAKDSKVIETYQVGTLKFGTLDVNVVYQKTYTLKDDTYSLAINMRYEVDGSYKSAANLKDSITSIASEDSFTDNHLGYYTILGTENPIEAAERQFHIDNFHDSIYSSLELKDVKIL